MRIVSFMNATQPPTMSIRKDRLAELRTRHGLESETDLAAAMGMNRSNISKVLNDKQQPGIRFQAALCLALEASPNDLFVIIGDLKASA